MSPERLKRIESTAVMALSGGIQSVPLRVPSPQGSGPFSDVRHRRRFLAACHRAFEKAQDQIVSLLEELHGDSEDEERERTELIIRKIAGGIGVMMLQHQTHIMRRFCIHPRAPGLEIQTVKVALREANRLNGESRQTFALVADLTTFIHVADLLRVDLRETAKVELIELKSGKVNGVLMSALENYSPDPEAVKRIATDPAIHPDHKRQAVRMMNQRVRVHRAEEFLKKDEGIDPGLGVPIQLSGPMIVVRPFDAMIDQLCDEAGKKGFAAGSVDSCLHIGAGRGATPEEASQRAFVSLNHVIAGEAQNRPDGFTAIQQEVVGAVGTARDDNFNLIDLFVNNLHSIATRPFLLWEIKRPHLLDVLSGNMRLVAAFDLQKFVWLARREGANLGFTSRREAEELKKRFGTINIMTWGHRAITYPYGEATMYFTTALFGRIINELMRPLQLIREMLLPSAQKVAEFAAWAERSGASKPKA